MNQSRMTAVGVVLILILSTVPARAAIVGSTSMLFGNLMTNMGPGGDDLDNNFQAYLKVVIEGIAADSNPSTPLDRVAFTLSWLPGATAANNNLPPALKTIYVFDGILAPPLEISGSAGVDFKITSGAPQSAILNALDAKGVYGGDPTKAGYVQPSSFTPEFGIEAKKDGSNSNSVQPGETVTVKLGVDAGIKWSDVSDRLLEPKFWKVQDVAGVPTNVRTDKIGIIVHVGSLDTRAGSEWGYSLLPPSPPPQTAIPEPSTLSIWAILSLVCGVLLARRRMSP